MKPHLTPTLSHRANTKPRVEPMSLVFFVLGLLLAASF
jgi:hypothetical protein